MVYSPVGDGVGAGAREWRRLLQQRARAAPGLRHRDALQHVELLVVVRQRAGRAVAHQVLPRVAQPAT